MASEEDDLLLGAEAKSVVHQNFEESSSSGRTKNAKGLDMPGKAGKSMAGDSTTAEDVKLNLEKQMRLQTDLPHQESQNSENSVSVNSLDQILEDRKGDPETILKNLGFSGSYSDVKCRIPDRFLLTPSKAYGISVEKFLEGNPKLREFLEEKNAIQNPVEMMMTTSSSSSSEVPSEERRMARTGSDSFYQAALTVTMVNRFKRLTERGRWAALFRGGVPIAEAVVQETPRGCRYWSVLPKDNRSFLETSGYYDELWSSVSVASDPTDDSRLKSCCTVGESKTTESKSPKLFLVASHFISKQLHSRQEVEESSTNTNDDLMFPWSKQKESSSSVHEAETKPQLTFDVHIEGCGPQFQPQPSAKNIPGRFLANPSTLVPSHLMIFDESKCDLDLQQSLSKDSSAVVHVGTEMSERTGLKTELPITESSYQKYDDRMHSTGNCSISKGDCIDEENRMVSSFREALTVSDTMESKVSERCELPQTLKNHASHDVLETKSNGICEDQTFMDSHDTSSTVLSVSGGDIEPADFVALPVSDGLELSSSAVIHSDAVAASNDSLRWKSTAKRKERFCLKDFRAFSIDVAETCSSNDPQMISIINGKPRLKKDDMIHQLSIQSGSSGFAEGDQLDVSLQSINDVLAPSSHTLQNMETPRLEYTNFRFSACESPDFLRSDCTQRPLSEGSDDCFRMFSQSSYKTTTHCTTSTQTDSLDVSSVSPHGCFSAQNISQDAASTHHGFQQNLLNNRALSKAERKTTAKSDNICRSINDGCCVSDVDASKQYRTEVTILVNQSSVKSQNLKTSRLIYSSSESYDMKKFNGGNASSSVEMDAVDPRIIGNQTSLCFRLDQSSLVKCSGQSRSSVDSLDGHQSELSMSGHSSPVRYRSKSDSFPPDQHCFSFRDHNQTTSLRDSFDRQDSYNCNGRVLQLSASSDDREHASVIHERRYEESFSDVSEHQMLHDQLKDSGFVHPQSLPSFLQPPMTPISLTPKWKQCVKDELKLMDFAVRKYKLQNKLLHRRMCKAIDSSGCSRIPGVLLQDERDDLDMLEILHNEIMEELDKMEELLMQRLKRFLRSHAYDDEKHLPLSSWTSQCILHSLNQLLHEQDYQSNIVNSINCPDGPSDQLSDSSSPLLSSPPPLLLHSVPIVSLQQLNHCLASVETLLSEMQKKSDVTDNATTFEQPAQKLLDENKQLKRRKSYRRFLPACAHKSHVRQTSLFTGTISNQVRNSQSLSLKPQWPKKQPVFKQQMSLPNIKDDH